MVTAHEVHRVMDERLLFGAFQRQPQHIKSFPSDLVHLPGQQRRSSPIGSSRSALGNAIQSSQYKSKASSEILQTEPSSRGNYRDSPEAEEIDRWFKDIQRYEHMLEEVAAASLDQDFKDELQHINRWLQCRSDAERTAALYTIVQNASQIQIRFLITVLQKLANSHSDPYPAGQDTTSSSEIISYYRSLHANTSQSVISCESDYEKRRRQLYPSPPPVSTNNRKFGRFSSAVSEPNDVGRQNRDILASRSLGGLSHPGPLYEKALAAQAQLQAISSQNSSAVPSTASSSILSSSSSSSLSHHGSTGGLFLSPPKLRTASTNTQPLFSPRSATNWPFPIGSELKGSPDNDSQSWSFGSLTNKKERTTHSAPGSTTSSVMGAKKNEDCLPWAIQEEQEEYSKLSATITSSLNTLEQAQARLRQDLPSSKPFTTNTSHIPLSSKKTLFVQTSIPLTPSPSPSPPLTKSVAFALSETSEKEEEKQLTGLARRRKRSSAARALKDKIAAETVDFELMKDVQNWLRSLRLHKYGHAFIGLDWKQVVRMSDQDMIDAGVNTIGARRKLLKVFENVVKHCEENDIEYGCSSQSEELSC